jgi:hypothetical protein
MQLTKDVIMSHRGVRIKSSGVEEKALDQLYQRDEREMKEGVVTVVDEEPRGAAGHWAASPLTLETRR